MLRVMLLIPGASYRAPDFMAAAARLDIDVVVGTDERHPLQDLQPARQVAPHRPSPYGPPAGSSYVTFNAPSAPAATSTSRLISTRWMKQSASSPVRQ